MRRRLAMSLLMALALTASAETACLCGVALYEDEKFDAQGNSEGSTMTAVFVDDPSQATPMTDHMNCRVLAFKERKSFTYWAGASWSGAGEITTSAQWHGHVRDFRNKRSQLQTQQHRNERTRCGE